jgi:hypothetical protein
LVEGRESAAQKESGIGGSGESVIVSKERHLLVDFFTFFIVYDILLHFLIL